MNSENDTSPKMVGDLPPGGPRLVAGFNQLTLRCDGATPKYPQRSNCKPPGCRKTELPRHRYWKHLAEPTQHQERADRSALNLLVLQHQYLAFGAPIA